MKILIVILLFLFSGCVTTAQDQWRHNCIGNVIRDAWTYEQQTGRTSRIVVTHIEKGKDHVQAQGKDENGEWIWLTTHNSSGGILRKWTKHFDKKPFKTMSLDDFIEEQKKYRERK